MSAGNQGRAGAEIGRAATTPPTRLWFAAALAGFALGCLVFVVAKLPDVSALSMIFVVLGFFFVPYVILLVGAVGTLAYWRDRAVRARAIAAVIFALAWATTQILLSQLDLAGVV